MSKTTITVGQATITIEADETRRVGDFDKGIDHFVRSSVSYDQAIEDLLHAFSRVVSATVGEDQSYLVQSINEMRLMHGDFRSMIEHLRRERNEQVQREAREGRE